MLIPLTLRVSHLTFGILYSVPFKNIQVTNSFLIALVYFKDIPLEIPTQVQIILHLKHPNIPFEFQYVQH